MSHQNVSLFQAIRKLRPFLRPLRAGVLGIVLLAALGALAAAGEPLAAKFAFDELGMMRSTVLVVLGIGSMLGLLAAREGIGIILDRTLWRTRLELNHRLTRATVERLHALPLAYHKSQSVGAITNRMDRGIGGLCSAFSEATTVIFPALVFLLVAIVVMVRLDWRLCVVALLLAPIPPLLGVRAAPEQAERERELTARWSRLFGRFNEVLSGISTVKAYVMEETEKQRFLSAYNAANQRVIQGVKTDSLTTAKKNVAAGLARIAAIVVGGILLVRNEISIGTLVAFVGYVAALYGPVQSLTGAYQTLQRAKVAFETVFEILDVPDPLADAPGAKPLENARGEVELRNVSFAYGTKPVLRNVSLRVSPGQTLALVGPSGGGKSTITKLIQRLYDPTEGKVLVDGRDVRSIEQRSLRSHIGVVLQDGGLFSDSVLENIAFGRPGATREEVERAARAANAHEFIMRLPQGYDTPVGERGSRLSGGEAQRIQIARAILKDPAILILDEATSALDVENEALVQEALQRLERGRTTIVVAHRLSTVRGADRIAVLREGRLVESGTHGALVERRGAYASLVGLGAPAQS